MYGAILLLHNWNRWLVLSAGVATIAIAIRGRLVGREWTQTDQRLTRAFISSLDVQATLGLLLYFVLSPIVPKTMAEFKAAMHVSALRFFAIEHITMMLLALIAAHVTAVLGKRAVTSRARQGRVAWGVALTLLLILAALPWHWLVPEGRPLLRWL
jgi:hypothetical protein